MHLKSTSPAVSGYIRREGVEMLTEAEILQFISDDKTSDKKKHARVGQKYYGGEHDILNYKLYYYNADGKLVEDTDRSNIKIPHPFFTELVDQEVQYMLSGKDGFVKSDLPELQAELNNYFNENEDFISEFYDTITGTISKGFDYMYAYKNAEGKTAFQNADSLGVVEIRAKDSDDKTEHLIYHYMDRIEKGKKEIKRIEVWDKDQTYFYVQVNDGKLELDNTYPSNPLPHIVKVDEAGEKYDGGGYGFIPFFRLDNNKKQVSDLKPIKPIIDDYDLMSCGMSNNIQDGSEMYWVVKGYDGDISELVHDVRTKKQVGVDNEGDVDIKTINIPYQARQAKLDLDEKNIYRFGMGFNSAAMGDGNITNIVIKSRYALLDLKCNKLEIRLKQFLRKLLKVVLQEINDEKGTDYQQKDVYFNFEREVMTNAKDNADIELVDAQKKQVEITILLNLQALLDNETLMQAICDVLDIDYEEIKGKLPDPDEATKEVDAAQAVLQDIPADNIGGDGMGGD